jgi:ribosome recycling factor
MIKDIYEQTNHKMDRTVELLKEEYAAMKAGRANPHSLEKILVDYYGTPTPVNQMAAVSVTEARILTIQPWDASTVRAIERAIQASDIGINPQSDGKSIRLIFPALTEDTRKQLARDVHKMAEDAKVAVRAVRREAIEKLKALKKSSEITEDELKTAEKTTQELTDKHCSSIDSLAHDKEKEVMSI